MLLNRLEFLLMNNPVRATVQRRVVASNLLQMGGDVEGGVALEIGCGRGVGAEVILEVFDAVCVHAFDLDPRMVGRARRRLQNHGARAQFWVGDATSLACADEQYHAVFDFGILHHVPDWQAALAEIHRVLAPGGRLYAEEVLAPAVWRSRHFLKHPQENRFDADGFESALERSGLQPVARRDLGHSFGWFVARKPAAT